MQIDGVAFEASDPKVVFKRVRAWAEPMGWRVHQSFLTLGEHRKAAFHPAYGWADLDVMHDGTIALRRPGGEQGDFHLIEHSLHLYADGSGDTNDEPGFPPILRRDFVLDYLDEHFPDADDESEEESGEALRGNPEFWREHLPRIPKAERLTDEQLRALDELCRAKHGRAIRASDLPMLTSKAMLQPATERPEPPPIYASPAMVQHFGSHGVTLREDVAYVEDGDFHPLDERTEYRVSGGIFSVVPASDRGTPIASCRLRIVPRPEQQDPPGNDAARVAETKETPQRETPRMAAEKTDRAQAPQPAKAAPLPVLLPAKPINWSELADKEPPERRWAIREWLGFGHISLLIGRGSIGKSLLAQQIASALALGQPFIDDVLGPLRVLYWACEDDHDELWRRQTRIAAWLDAGLDAFTDNLFIAPRLGLENTLASTEYGRLLYTPVLEQLREQAMDLRADVVILDNVAHLYGGNENDRPSVTAFQNSLTGALAGLATLLLGHPSRSPNSEFSGSSAWENAARTRLYLGDKLPDQKGDPDEEPADDVRYLARRKANYSSRDWRRFNYANGVLVPEDIDPRGGIVAEIRERNAEKALLDGVQRLKEIGQHPTDGTTSPRFLPRLMAEFKLSQGISRPELADAMRRLILAGKLRRAQVGRREGNRAVIYGLEIA